MAYSAVADGGWLLLGSCGANPCSAVADGGRQFGCPHRDHRFATGLAEYIQGMTAGGCSGGSQRLSRGDYRRGRRGIGPEAR
jgi:hypothetical protein